MELNCGAEGGIEIASGLKIQLEEAVKKCIELEVLSNAAEEDRNSESGNYEYD